MYETKNLIEAARERGITTSRRKLSDWANRSLIAHPIRHGRGRGKGVLFEWPNDTLERINAIFPAMEGFHDERFAIMFGYLDSKFPWIKFAGLSYRRGKPFCHLPLFVETC